MVSIGKAAVVQPSSARNAGAAEFIRRHRRSNRSFPV